MGAHQAKARYVDHPTCREHYEKSNARLRGEEAKCVLEKGGSRNGFQGLPHSTPSRLRTPSLWLPCLVFVHALQNSSSCRRFRRCRDLGIHSLTHNYDFEAPEKPPALIGKLQYRHRPMMVNEKATERPTLPLEAICPYN